MALDPKGHADFRKRRRAQKSDRHRVRPISSAGSAYEAAAGFEPKIAGEFNPIGAVSMFT